MDQNLRRSTSVNARLSWAERNSLAAVAPDGCLSAAVRQAIKIFIQEQNFATLIEKPLDNQDEKFYE